jgi:glucosamine--fructose-6-phosphate aminotransferase (isomerizing)
MSTEHHMLSHILESGAALQRTLRASEDALQGLATHVRERECARVVLSGMGSSYTAARVAQPAFDELVREATHVLPCTELRHHAALLDERTLVVILSRSGERQHALDALNIAEQSGALTVAVTGVPGSSLARAATRNLLTAEGEEISFCNTKSVTATIGLLISLAIALSNRGTRDLAALRAALHEMPDVIDHGLEEASRQMPSLGELLHLDRLIVAGSGGNAGVAHELSLVLQESALVMTQWMDTGNVLHAPLTPLGRDWLVALMVTPDDAELSSDALRLVKAYGARTLGLVAADVSLEPSPDHVLPVPATPERLLWPLVYLPVLQLLTYHWTVARGFSPDTPERSQFLLAAVAPTSNGEPDERQPRAAM